MTVDELVQQLRELSNPERLRVIEAVTRMVCDTLPAEAARRVATADNPLLQVNGCIEAEPVPRAEFEHDR